MSPPPPPPPHANSFVIGTAVINTHATGLDPDDDDGHDDDDYQDQG